MLGTTFMLHSNHAVSADTVPTTTPTDATVQTDSNVADHQSSEVPLRTTADKEETVATTTNAEEKVVATNTQDTTQDKDKQTNANETTQDTTNVDKKDPEVKPANDATIPKTTPKFKVRAALPARKAVVNPTSTDPTTSNHEEASTSLPMSNQDIKLNSQPMLTEIINKPKDNWVYKNMKWYPEASTAEVKEILQKHTTNDDRGRYYFAGAANYNESYHVVYLLARSNNLNDNNLYVTILHTATGNIQEEVVAPGESKKVEYSGTGGTTHAPIFTNYDGTSVSIGLDGVEKGDNNIYGMVVGFAYGHNTGIYGEPASMGNGFMMTPMPTKTTTTIHYIDQATGDELAVPKSFEGVAYQKYTITGEAPTIDGYTLKQSPKTTGYISPYKVGESYDFRLDKHVVIKQTVINSQGLVRVTAYYDGEAINNTTRYLGNMLNVNDRMSIVSHGKSYTYINQITSTNDGIVYYYAKDGSEDKSEVRVHYIDVTGNKSSIFVPGDGKEVATDKISGKLGENYNYNVNLHNVNLSTDYNLATNQANTVNGTYTIDHHDEYVYVVKKTSAEKLDPTVKAKTKVDDPTKLTDDEKKEVEDNIRANNPGLPKETKIEVGDNGDTKITYPDKSVDTISGDKLVEGKRDAAKNEPKVPGDKVKVDDPNKLTEDEKSEVVKAVEDANKDENGKSTLPEGSKVTVGDNGDVTVTYPDGSKDTIPGDKVVEGKSDADKNELKVPSDKVKVDDPNKLTEDEKSEVVKAVEDANKDENGKSTLPEGSKVTVGDNGDVTVTYPDGSKDTIPGDKVVEGKSDADKNELKVPSDKVKVDDPNKLTEDEKSEVVKAVEDANKDENGKSTLPEGSKVTVGDNGDVTVTYPDGSKDTIPGDRVVEGKGTEGQTDSVTVYATDGTTSLTFNKPNGGVIGQTWDSANGKDNNCELILHLSGAKAGSKIVITIPGADTFTISGTISNTPVGADTPISIDSQYGTVTTVQQNYTYTITVNITNTVNGTLNLPIYLRHVPNGYKLMPIPLHDPMGDTTKTITWMESVNNGPVQTQDNTGLTFISRQMPSWNPGQNVTDTSNYNGKQFINNSQITYSYAVNEDDGVVASEDGKPNYPAAQVNSAVNFGTTITIPMPKGFVLDQDATNQLIAGWYDDKLPDNPVTIIQDGNGNVVITVPKGQGFQNYNNKPAYQFVGHYENITQQDKSFTLYGGNITIEQQLNGTTKYFKSTSKVSDTFYGKNDNIQISNVSDWINAPWKTKYGNDFIPYWTDQHDQVIAYAGFDNGFVTSLNNSTITFTIPDGLVVHGLRVPKVAGISSYNYTYTLDDGSTHSGTVTAGEEITINDKNRTITSIDLNALTIPVQTETTTAKDATDKNRYDDAEQRYVSQDNTGAFEFIGHLGATKRDGKTKLTMGEILSLNMRLRVPVNDGYKDFLQTTKVEAVTSADTASVIGQCFGAYSSNSLSLGLHMMGGYTLEDLEATSYYIKDPVFYVILPKGFAYGGIMSTSTNPSTPKVSSSNDSQGNTIVKLDYTGQQFDVRKIVNLKLNTMPDITNGTKIISAFVYSPTTALSPEFDHPYSVPAAEKSWFAADQQNEHLYNIGNFNSIDITKAVSDLHTTSWAQGNQDLDMSSSQGNAKADGKQNMSFTVWINNDSTYNVTNAKTIINLPTKTTDGKGFDFHLTGPVDYTGNTKVVIKYATQAFNLSKNSTQAGYVPDTTNFVDADQVSDWSKVKSILVEVPSLVSGAVIDRININGVDSNLLYDGGQTGYLGTGLYMAGFMPSVKQQAAQIKIAPAEKKHVSYQFVDDDNKGADVGNPVVVLGEPGSTQSVSLTVPTGYQLASGQTLPTSVTIGTDNQTVDIHLVHTVSTATLSGSNQSTYTGSAITVDNLNGGTIKVNVQGVNSGQYTLKVGDVEFSSDNGKTWSKTMPTNAGDYQICLTDQGRQAIEKQYGGNGINWVDANSNSTITGIATYTIDKAKATATIGGSITRKYNGQAVNGTTVYGQITWTGKDTSNNQDFTLKHDISASDYSWYTMGKDGQYVKFDSKPTNAGTYYLILNKDYINKLDQANPNYDITKVDGAFTYIINKATATLNLAGSQDANYNGQSIAINYGNFPLSIKTSNDLTLTLPSGKSLDAGDVEITDANGNKVTAPTAIGTYTIKLTQAGLQKFESQTDNYAWASDGSATLTITRNDHVSVTLTNNADGAEIVVYTGKTAAIDPSKFTVTLGNGLTYQLKAGDLQFVDQTAGANTNVGTYQVELSQQGKDNIVALEAANYGYDFSKAGNGTVTVTKATPTVTLNGDAEKTYDGTSIADYVPTITIKAPGTNSVTLTTGDFEWVKDGHIYTTAPSDAGTYTAELTEQGLNKLKAVNATNLDWSKITSVMGGTYKIDKAKVNATLSGNSETKTPSLNAGDYTLDLTVSGKQQTITLTNDDLVLSQNGQAVNQLTKAGTYDVKFSQKFMDYLNSTYPSGNYDVNTSSNAIFTLDNSSQTINYVDANGKVIGSTNVGGDAIEGTTVPFDSQDHVPAGWVITNPSAAPTKVTLENGTTTIAIQHGTITVRPGEKAPTGKVPGDPSKTYAKMDDLTKTPTRTIIVAIPGETTPRTIPQSVTFERSATYDTVTGKATYSDWKTGDTKSWAKVDPTLKGYTTIIDNQPGATIPAVTDITEQTVNVTINVTYVKNAATITISGPAQSKTYDGQAAEITDKIANKISHQISGDSRLTLPDGSQVTLTKDDFSFAGPEGNILTGNPSSVGTYHIVLNKNGLYKIEGLDSNFTWSYDPQTSYVVYTINSAQAGSVAFNASATKTYDGSNVLNGASFTTQPSIVIKGADGKPLAGTKGYTFQSGDFEFVDSKGNVTLATIDSAGQITGPTNAGTYTIQLTQAGLNRIEAANPNVDFSNVKLADIGTGTLTINQYAPTLNLAGNGKKTYDGQTVTSAELIKSDKYNNITITFTVPKQGGGTTTVTYIFNPEMDYTGDYDWYDNGAQIAAPKNAGTYTIQLKADQVKNIFNDLLSKDANYSYLKGNINTDKLRVSGKATYTINKKPLTVYLTGNGGMTYNGSGATMPLQDLLKNLTAEGLVGKETLGTFTFDDADFQWYVKNADGTYSVFNGKDAQGHSVQTPINVGTYYIGILPETSTNSGIDTLKRDNSNYDVTIDYSKYYQFDIKKAQGTATLSGNQTDTYNGQAHTINGYTLTVSGTGIQDGQTVTLNAGDLEFNVKGQWTTNVPVNAGNYQVRLNAAKLAELEKNYPNLAWDNDHVTNSALDYIVNPTQVTVSFTSGPSHSTYNGSALNIEYTKDFFQGRFAMNGVVAGQTLNFPKINSGFFEWVDASGNVMTSVPINAGTYTLKVKDLNELNDLNPNYQLVFSKDTNGNDQNGWTWVIDKATARINFTSDSQTTPWTGKATVLDPNNFAVTITTDNGQALTSDALTVDDFQFYNQAGQAIDIPTEVGNYTIKLKAAGLAKIKKDTANYVWTNIASGNYEITKAAATIKLDGNSSMTYNGQAASFPVNADGSLNGYTVTLSNGQTYTLKPGDLRFSTMVTGADGKSYLEVTNAPVNAGTYDVTLSDNGLANINKVDGSHYQYTLDSSTATFTINKAEATIAINGSGKHTYDGQAAKTSEGNYTIQLPGQSTTTNVAADDLVFVDANGKVITAPTNAGTYTIALSDAYKQSLQGTYGNNYNLNYTNGTFTVAPKVVDLILNGTASQFYDGQPAKITDVSGLTLTWGDHTTITAPGGVKFALTPDDLEVVDGQGNVPTKANEADQATNPYYIKLKDAVLAGLNSQNKNYTFKIGDTYARYTIFAKESNVKLTGKQFVNYGDNPMPAINIQDGNFKLTWTDASGKDQDITLTADDLTVEVPDGVSKDKYGLPTKAGQYVVKLKQGVIDKLNEENRNYHLSNNPNTNAWYVVKHRQVSFTINGTPSSTYNGQATQIKDGNYSISFGPVSGNQNSGVLSDDQSAFNGIKWDAGDFEFVNGAPTNAGTYQVRLMSKTGLQKLSEFAQGATGSNYDFSSVATIENGQITASSVTANYTINKNQLDISLTNKNGQVPSSIIGDYNLNADDYTLTITPKNTTVYDKYGKPLSFTYKLQNNDVFYVKGLPSNVGTYSVQLTAEALQKIEQQFGTDNFDYNPSTSASREITQGNAVITVSGGQTVYYNGKPAVLRHKKYQVTVSTDFFSTGVSLNKGDMAKMVFYTKNADGSYTELTDESGKPVKPTNAGTYYVGLNSDMVKMLEDATGNEGQNYKWTFNYAPYVIKSVNRTAIGNFSNNSNYNGQAIALQTITVTTKYPGATNTTYTLQNGDYEYVKDGQVVASPTDAGTYTIRLITAGENHIKQLGNVEGAEENNVNWTIQFTGSYTINQVRMTVTVNGTQNETYDGTAKTINIGGKNGINVTLSDDGLTVPTIPTTGENALTAADFTIKDAVGNIVTNPTNAGHYKVYLNATGLAKLGKLSPNFTVPASLDQAGDLNIARKEVSVTEDSAWKTFDAQSAALTDDQFAHYKDAIINAGKDAGIKDGYSVDGLTIDGIDWWFDDTVDYGTQGSMKNPIKDIGIYNLRLNAKGQRELDVANPNYKIKVGDFQYHIYPEVVHIELSGNQDANWDNQPVPVNPTNFVPTFVVYGGPNGKNPGPDDKPLKNPVRDDGQPLTLPAGVQLEPGDYEFVDVHGKVIKNFTRADGTTSTNPFKVGTYYVRLTEAGWMKLAILSTDNVKYQYNGSTGTLNINSITPQFKLNGQNWKTYDGQPVSYKELTSVDPTTKQPLVTVSITSNEHTITFPLNDGDYVWSANGQALTSAPTNVGTYTITLNKDKVMKSLQNFISSNSDYQGAMNILADNIGGSALFKIKALQIANITADPSSGSKTYDGTAAQIDLSTLAKSIKATTGSGKNEKVWSLNTSNLTLVKDYTVTDAKGNVVTDFPINAGTYTFKLNDQGIKDLAAANTNFTIPSEINGYSYIFTINPVEAKAVLSGQAAKTYDGNQVTTAEINAGTSTVTVSINANKTVTYVLQDGDYIWYVKNADGSWTKLDKAPIDAGTYKVEPNNDAVLAHLREKIADDPEWTVGDIHNVFLNDSDLSGSAEFTIKKKPVTLIISDNQTSTADPIVTVNPQKITVSGNGITISNLKADDFQLQDIDGNVVKDPKLAGKYIVALTPAAQAAIQNGYANYQFSFMGTGLLDVQAKLTINFVDTDEGNKVIQTSTKSGDVGTPLSLSLTLPAGYQLADGQTLPTSYQFTDALTQTLNINLKHATQSVEDSKTVTRTINYTDPTTGEVKTLTTQPVTLTRTGSTDLVTHKTTWQDWTTGNWAAISANDIPTFAGYTPSQTSVAAETVTGQTSNSTVNITYTANDQSTHIIYQDAKGNTVKTDTVSGKTDQTVDTNSSLPTGWKIAETSKVKTIPSTITFKGVSTPDTVIVVDHVMTPVDHTKPLQPGAKTPTGKVIDGAHDADLNKTITRTINVKTPNGKITTTKQVANLYRDATYDDVTGEVAYDDWSTDIWKAFTPDAIPGYTVETVPMETVTADMSNKTVNVAYTADKQTVMIKFVDDNENGKQVGELIPKQGVTDQTITDFSNVKVPEYYQLAKNSSLPTSYTFTAAKDQTITIYLVHATKTVDGKDPATIPSGVDKNQLIHMVTRTITDNVPGQNPIITKQTATITRRATYDEVTSKLSNFSDWTTAELPGYPAKGAAGYTPSQSELPAEAVISTTEDSSVDITYTAGKQTVTIKFVDDNNGGQPVTSVTKAGQTGETITDFSNVKVPEYYQLAKNSSLPTSYTFTADKDQAITIHLIHATKTVDGNKPDTILSDVDKKQLIHTVTRTITDYVPGQEPLITKQSATITRRATYDEVTGKLSNFSDWTTAELPGYTAKGAAGYTASETDVPAETVTSDTKDEVISITYTANTQTGKISYQDQNGKEIDSTSLSGKTGETVTVTPQIPAGWKIVAGQNIPKTVTATADGVPTVVVKIEHATTKVPHTDPVKPGAKTPTGKVIDGAHDADLNKTITRTINVKTPDGTMTTTKQVAKLYRDATYDDVTGEVIYGAWSTDSTHWATFTPDAIPGYTVETVPVVEVKNGQRDVTVNVTYTAKNIQNIIKYVDENGNVVKTDTVTGKLGDPIKVTIPTGYHVADGKLPTLTIGDGAKSVQTVHVIKDQHNTDNPIVDHKDVLNIIKYVDENGNVVKTNHVTGKLGDPIKVTIPDGYHVADGQLPTLTIGDGAKSVQTVHVIKDQHNTDNPIVDHKDVLNIIKYVDENGNVVKTDHVTGKLGDPITITITIPAGYHVKDGKLPTLTIGDGAKSVQTVHVIKDQHNTDNPIVDHKDVLNIIKYVDENGNVVKTDTVTGHVGDPMSEATTSGSKQQAQQLPQTGNARHESGLAALGLALLGLIGLVPKKRRHDN